MYNVIYTNKCNKCSNGIINPVFSLECRTPYHSTCALLSGTNSDGSYAKCCKQRTHSPSSSIVDSGAIVKAIQDLLVSLSSKLDGIDSKLNDLVTQISNTEIRLSDLSKKKRSMSRESLKSSAMDLLRSLI